MIKIEICHNISQDNWFGLNSVFSDSEKRYVARAHPLVKVFECQPEDSGDSDDALLTRAWEAFNAGSDREDPAYFARKLRSLSVGDVVRVDGRAYSCESVGWKHRADEELRILTPAEADPVIRQRFGFMAGEPLKITVPWDDGTPDPKPFSRAFDLLYDEYRRSAHGSWEAWLKSRRPVECGDCGDRLALPDPARSWVHLDDGSPACTSRSEADARRARQARPAVGGAR